MFKVRGEDDKRFMEAAKAVLSRFKSSKIKAKEFDMGGFATRKCSVARAKGGCNTSHCIGGWIDLELGGDGNNSPIHSIFGLSTDLEMAAHALFFPEESKNFYATRKDATQALTNFIKKHDDPWKRVKLSEKAKKAYAKAVKTGDAD